MSKYTEFEVSSLKGVKSLGKKSREKSWEKSLGENSLEKKVLRKKTWEKSWEKSLGKKVLGKKFWEKSLGKK